MRKLTTTEAVLAWSFVIVCLLHMTGLISTTIHINL